MEDTVRDAISKARRSVLTNTNKRVSRVLKRLLQVKVQQPDESCTS